MTPRVNDLVRGKYRIVRLIGDGGMGSVYEARHEGLGSPVALKFLHPDLARRPGLAQRFAREARVSAAIQSPHVTRVTDVDLTEDGTPYLVMELLNGRSLGALLDGPPEGRPSRDESVDFALQILLGLEAAHALGVVHRDLKPDNVFITTTPGGPVAKLIDFGIAKVKESGEYKQGLTFAGILMGTPEYMAPEQLFSANAVDRRADLYSLGVMLFEMLAGERPAEGDNPAAIVASVQSGAVKRLDRIRPDLPSELIDIVHTALSANPAERFDTAYTMRTALARSAGRLSPAGQLAVHAPFVPTAQHPVHPLSVVPQSTVPKTDPPEHVAAPRAPSQLVSPPNDASTPERTEPPAKRASGTVLTSAGSLTHAHASLGAQLVSAPNAHLAAPRRRSRGVLPWVLGVTACGLAVALGVVAFMELSPNNASSGPPPLPTPLAATPVVVTAEARDPAPEPSASPVSSAQANTSTPTSTTSQQSPRNPPVAPTSPTTTPSATPSSEPPPLFTLPFPLPSTLPPLPSTLPPLPEGLPTALPSGFPTFPGFTPPASSSQPDAGSR